MGLYDTLKLPDGSTAQVKLWDEGMATYEIGDTVPSIGSEDYAIALRETNNWAVIKDGILVYFTLNKEPPENLLLVDKWGGGWEASEANSGLMGEEYWFKDDPEL